MELALRYRNNMNGALPPWLVQWFSSIGLPKYLNQERRPPSSPAPPRATRPSPAPRLPAPVPRSAGRGPRVRRGGALSPAPGAAQIAAQCKLLTETTHPIADAAPAA